MLFTTKRVSRTFLIKLEAVSEMIVLNKLEMSSFLSFKPGSVRIFENSMRLVVRPMLGRQSSGHCLRDSMDEALTESDL